MLGGLRQPLYAQCYSIPSRYGPSSSGRVLAIGGIYRSLPPNVSSSAFYTIYRFPRSSRAPRRIHMHGGAVVCSMNGKRYGLTLALPS